MITCDFCDKSNYAAKKMIASKNNTHICDECVSLCLDILAGRAVEKKLEILNKPPTKTKEKEKVNGPGLVDS